MNSVVEYDQIWVILIKHLVSVNLEFVSPYKGSD